MNVIIREMRFFDFLKLRNLKADDDYGVLFTGEEFPYASRIYNKFNLFVSLISRRIAPRKFVVFVLMIDGKVEGIIHLTLGGRKARFAVFINEKCRGKGYERALMETALDWTKEHKMDLKLTVKESNRQSKTLNEKMGFRVYDTTYRMIKSYKPTNKK